MDGGREKLQKDDQILLLKAEDETILCKHGLCGDIFQALHSSLLLKSLNSEISMAI